MLRNTELPSGRRSNKTSSSRIRNSDDSLLSLIDRLQRLNFEIPPLFGRQNNIAGGAPMQLSVRKWLQSGSTSGMAINAVRKLLKEQTPCTLSLSDLGSGDAVINAMQRFCEFLRLEIATSNRSGEHIGICVNSHELPLQAFQAITNSVPGCGPRYVFLDGLQTTQHNNLPVEREMDETWSFLWRDRMKSMPLIPVYGAMVRTACPLLADEVAASVLPVYGIPVPVDSAWLPVSLALQQFADDAGELRWDQLSLALAGGVGLADKLMDRLHWSHAGQQTDARLNRRLAMSITGLGDLVRRCGLNPQDLDALRWLSAIVVRIRKILWQHSGEMAQKDGCLPVLCSSDPSSGWDDSVHRDNWRRRWRVALEKSAVRHRNMLVLSPYSVVPMVDSCYAAYTDLLPVIACADAWSFADVPRSRSWNLSEFRTFHRRAWAVIQGCKTGTLVAAGV